MSPVRVTWNRTIGRARSLFSTGFAISGFLAASAALFAFRLDAAEGVSISVASVWASAVAPFLPALAAFLAMDVWSDELQSGRIELLLTAPVKEREFTLGNHDDALLFASALRKHHGAAHHLITLLRVDSETEAYLNRLVKLGG